MKRLLLLAAAPLLMANQFTARDFEFVAHFMTLIQANKLAEAKQMLAPKAVIRSWADYDGPPKSFDTFAKHMRQCPIHDLEAVVSKETRNLNVNLDCPAHGGANLHFKNGKISEINYGGPPPLVRTPVVEGQE